MTRHMHNPFRSEYGAQVYNLSAGLFFCLLQLYRDFSNKHAGFELTAYYDLYLDVSENKRVLNALFTPKSNLSDYLESYDFAYDIANQKRIDHAQVALKAIQEHLHIYNFDDNIHELILSANMLKNLYLSYQTFVYKNETGLTLRWHSYSVAFLGDEPLMALAIYSASDPDNWMNGTLGGLEGYVTFDLKRNFIMKSNVRIWGMPEQDFPIQIDEVAERKRQNKRLNKKIRKQNR